MNYLVDTHLLIWAAERSPKLSALAVDILTSEDSYLWVSAVSLWEIALKRSMPRENFNYDVAQFRAGLLATGYVELPVEGRHVLVLSGLPMLHTDPFDRLLIAQAMSEGMLLLTADQKLSEYGEHIKLVK